MSNSFNIFPFANACFQFVQKVYSHPLSFFFRKPYKPNKDENYFDIVKNPMDLTTIKKKLLNGDYISLKQWEAEVRLVFTNSILYNGETHLLGGISTYFLNKLDKFMDEIENSNGRNYEVRTRILYGEVLKLLREMPIQYRIETVDDNQDINCQEISEENLNQNNIENQEIFSQNNAQTEEIVNQSNPQNEEIVNQNDIQNEQIVSQNEQIVSQNEQIVSQNEVIDNQNSIQNGVIVSQNNIQNEEALNQNVYQKQADENINQNVSQQQAEENITQNTEQLLVEHNPIQNSLNQSEEVSNQNIDQNINKESTNDINNEEQIEEVYSIQEEFPFASFNPKGYGDFDHNRLRQIQSNLNNLVSNGRSNEIIYLIHKSDENFFKSYNLKEIDVASMKRRTLIEIEEYVRNVNNAPNTPIDQYLTVKSADPIVTPSNHNNDNSNSINVKSSSYDSSNVVNSISVVPTNNYISINTVDNNVKYSNGNIQSNSEIINNDNNVSIAANNGVIENKIDNTSNVNITESVDINSNNVQLVSPPNNEAINNETTINGAINSVAQSNDIVINAPSNNLINIPTPSNDVANNETPNNDTINNNTENDGIDNAIENPKQE